MNQYLLLSARLRAQCPRYKRCKPLHTRTHTHTHTHKSRTRTHTAVHWLIAGTPPCIQSAPNTVALSPQQVEHDALNTKPLAAAAAFSISTDLAPLKSALIHRMRLRPTWPRNTFCANAHRQCVCVCVCVCAGARMYAQRLRVRTRGARARPTCIFWQAGMENRKCLTMNITWYKHDTHTHTHTHTHAHKL